MFLELTGFPLILVSIIAFVVIFGLIVCLHEFGHFIVAKKSGIQCHEFSIGMGPALYKKQKGETAFAIRAIPLGGYVSMATEMEIGEYTKIGTKIGLRLTEDVATEIILDDALECDVRGEISDRNVDGKNGEDPYITLSDDMGEVHYYALSKTAKFIFEKNETIQLTPYERTFDAKPIWKRFLTLFAGPFMNFVLAMIIYIIIAFATGVPNMNSTKIGSISANYPAAEYLEVGDSITSVNGVSVTTWNSFQVEMKKLKENYETEVVLGYSRNGQENTVTMPVYTALVSIGLTNYQATNYKLTTIPGTDVMGLEVGNVGIRYKDKSSTGPLTKGDYITKIKFDGTIYDVESWSQLARLFGETEIKTAMDIQFEFYDLQADGSYTLVSLESCKVIEPYTDEVLSSQDVAKITSLIGVAPEYHFSFFGCLGEAFEMFWSDFTLIFRTLKLLIAPSSVRQVGVSDLSSVVGIFDLVKRYIGAGFLALLSLTAMLSVNIGVMNLLPIPALDGGRIVFLLWEAITRKKPSKKVENIITLVFMALLLLLFVFVTYNDILRLIR